MSSISYRRAEYSDAIDKERIIALYRDIFHLDFRQGYDRWFGQNDRALGVVAADDETGQLVGHFASVRFDAVIGGSVMPFRMSMGFMTSPAYRGRGIATNLYRELRRAITEGQDAMFVIGFPNDVSYGMHVGRMDYVLQRQFHFTLLPKRDCIGVYKKTDAFFEQAPLLLDGRNHLAHAEDYMRWRYPAGEYDIWLSETGQVFVSTRFRDKVDILYWSADVTERQLLDFAAFLYAEQKVERVTTWDSEPFLDAYPKEERAYHMCINTLDCDPAVCTRILGEWRFCMGDCELF